MDELVKSTVKSFELAIIDMEALHNYFETTRDLLNKKKKLIDDKYRIALHIAELLDKIYEEEIEQRENEIAKLSKIEIEDSIKVMDVIELSLSDNNEIIKYVLKDGFQNEKFSPAEARKKQAMVYNQEDIFIRAILSNIIIIFEKFLATQYNILVCHKPKEYFENKMISISDLLEKDLDNVINQEIENEVNANMFDSIKALDKIFEKK